MQALLRAIARRRTARAEIRLVRSAANGLACPLEVATDAEVTRVFNNQISPGIEATALAGASRDYIAAEEHRPASMASRFLQAKADLDCVADARRKRYRQWLGATSGIPSAHRFTRTSRMDASPTCSAADRPS